MSSQEAACLTVARRMAFEKNILDSTFFKELGGNGYARCDYRMDANGDIYMLEINPNCGIFYPPHEPGSADFSLLNDPVTNHTKFMKLILHNAHNRRDRIVAERSAVKRPSRKRVVVEQMAYS